MSTTKPKFNPAEDQHLATFFLHRDEQGCFLDIDTHLYHSSQHGFYMLEKKLQFWGGRCWENVSEADQFSDSSAPRRILTCPCRPLTAAQVIRLVIEENVPEEEGARDMALKALQNAGLGVALPGHD